MRRFVALAAIALALSVSAVASGNSAARAPKNVILMIGDGMGPNQVIAAGLTLKQRGESLTMESLPVHRRVVTDNVNGEVTDSAAGATALATGIKTTNGSVAMDPQGRSLRTIFEAARAQGKSVGLVTTVSLPHATPACFAAHIDKRGRLTEIAEQLLASRADVLIGGGREFFVPKSQTGSRRTDEWDLLKRARAKGYQVALTPEEFRNARDEKLLALLQPGYLTTAAPEPPLSELTAKAIAILSRNPKGFFLMVEGGQIDSRCHENKLEPAIEELIEFDAAIATALEHARSDGSTLLAVTADHETGGLQIEKQEDGSWSGKFTTGGHTSAKVDLFAFGPGSGELTTARDNTDIPKAFARLWNVRIGLVGQDRAAAQPKH